MSKTIRVEVPESCFFILPSDYMPSIKSKVSPILIRAFSNSYNKTNFIWDATGEQAVKAVNNMNDRLGVSPEEAEAMLECSMFNKWRNYDDVLAYIKEKGGIYNR